jgi:hypothetical protein
VQRLLEKLILEEDQFDVHDILPNTMPDPASLQLKSDYACPVGQVVIAPDCGKLALPQSKFGQVSIFYGIKYYYFHLNIVKLIIREECIN